MDNIKLHPSSSLDVSFDESSDIAIGVHPSAALSLNVPSDVRGGDVIANGNFDTDTDWNKGGGWTITGGNAVANATVFNLDQMSNLIIGETYDIIYTVLDYVSGSVRCRCGTTSGISRTANGTYEQTLVCGGDTTFRIDGQVAFTGKIDNVRAYKV